MAITSMRARKRFFEIGVAGFVLCFAWLMQLTVLSLLPLQAVVCSLPMVFTVVWGLAFGSPLQFPRLRELTHVRLGQIMTIQALSGSPSGALVGAFFGALYASVLPVYPVCYPLIGWIAGYFCLRHFNQGTFLCIPLVLLLSVLAETIMAAQLAIVHRPDVFAHLTQVAIPEAVANSLIAPFVYYPMRIWYQFTAAHEG